MFYINYMYLQLLMDGQNKFTVYIIFYTPMKQNCFEKHQTSNHLYGCFSKYHVLVCDICVNLFYYSLTYMYIRQTTPLFSKRPWALKDVYYNSAGRIEVVRHPWWAERKTPFYM